MTDSTVDFNSDDIVNELSGLEDGQGEQQQTDNGPEQNVQPETTQSQEQQIADNPAWKPYLDKFDPSVHGQLREVLSDLDARTQRRFERQAELEKNYGQFAQAGVDPRILQAGYQLFQNLNTDPQSFYKKLGESLGITPQQAEDLVNGEDDEDDDPRLRQVNDRLEKMQEYLAQQQERQEREQFQQMTNQEEQRLNADLEKMKTQYNLQNEDLHEVLQRTYVLTQTNPAATVWEGLQQLLDARVRWQQNRPTNSAPSVLSGNGSGTAAPQTAFSEKSEKEQQDELVNLLKELS